MKNIKVNFLSSDRYEKKALQNNDLIEFMDKENRSNTQRTIRRSEDWGHKFIIKDALKFASTVTNPRNVFTQRSRS